LRTTAAAAGAAAYPKQFVWRRKSSEG